VTALLNLPEWQPLSLLDNGFSRTAIDGGER
jgi:hypothetical protein